VDLIETQLQDPISHWYYAHKFRIILEAIKGSDMDRTHLIDVGAGSALFSKKLSENHPNLRVSAVDINYSALEISKSTPKFSYLTSLSGVSGDIYFLTDILEHVYDDKEFLKEIVNSAPKGAKFVITVPALMTLWSNHDVFLKHFRRYSRSELQSLMLACGLELSRCHYLFGTVFPLAWLSRRVKSKGTPSSQLKMHSQILNRMMTIFLKIDLIVCHFLPFGVSLVGVGKKSD